MADKFRLLVDYKFKPEVNVMQRCSLWTDMTIITKSGFGPFPKTCVSQY